MAFFSWLGYFNQWRAECQASTKAILAGQAALSVQNVQVLANQQEGFRQLAVIQADLSEVKRLVQNINNSLIPVATKIRFWVSINGTEFRLLGENETMQVKVNEQINVHIEGADEFGNVAPFDKSFTPIWTPTGDAVVTVDPTDGSKASIVSTAHVPSTGNMVQVQEDADLSDGQKIIIGTLPIDWLPGDAVSVTIKVDSVVPVTPAP